MSNHIKWVTLAFIVWMICMTIIVVVGLNNV